eukprot:13811689-Heterocapsa_arctica.AAC.1
MVEMKVDTEKDGNLNNPEENQEKGCSIETQEYWHTAWDKQEVYLYTEDKAGGQLELTQDTGQKQDEQTTQYYNSNQILVEEKELKKLQQAKKRGSGNNEDAQISRSFQSEKGLN